MQTALSSLVDVKHNEQDLEDELADLLSKDEPNIPTTEKQNVPGTVLVPKFLRLNTLGRGITLMSNKFITTF